MASDRTAHQTSPACCPLPPGVPALDIRPELDDQHLERLARWAHALSDPVRLRMLSAMTTAQDCCRPGRGEGEPGAAGAGEAQAAGAGEAQAAGAGEAQAAGAGEVEGARRPAPAGVCVCELQSLQGLAQSTASYHLKVLRDAGLVREQRRGKWTFYAVDDGTAAEFAAALRGQLGLSTRRSRAPRPGGRAIRRRPDGAPPAPT